MNIKQVIGEVEGQTRILADDGDIYRTKNVVIGRNKAGYPVWKPGWVKEEILDIDIVAKYKKINDRLTEISSSRALFRFNTDGYKAKTKEYDEILKTLPLMENK